MTYTIYPDPQGDNLFYVEFTRFQEFAPMQWRLFRRNMSLSEAFGEHPLMGELHPFKLAEGVVTPPDCVDLYTEAFLKYMVDAMNEKHNNAKINYAKKTKQNKEQDPEEKQLFLRL